MIKKIPKQIVRYIKININFVNVGEIIKIK